MCSLHKRCTINRNTSMPGNSKLCLRNPGYWVRRFHRDDSHSVCSKMICLWRSSHYSPSHQLFCQFLQCAVSCADFPFLMNCNTNGVCETLILFSMWIREEFIKFIGKRWWIWNLALYHRHYYVQNKKRKWLNISKDIFMKVTKFLRSNFECSYRVVNNNAASRLLNKISQN
jgi:hypothetical protein